MQILDKFKNKNKNKIKETINNTTTCTANMDKPECSLIEELRELQNKRDKLSVENSELPHCSCLYDPRFGLITYGIRIHKDEFNAKEEEDEELLKQLKDIIETTEIYIANHKEMIILDKRIAEIKHELGIQ